MRKHVLCLALMILSVVLIHAQSSNTKSTAVSNSSDAANVRDRQALLQLERDIVKAQLNGDTGMVIHRLARDYKWIGPQARSIDRAQFVMELSPEPVAITLRDTLMEARVSGNAGVVTGVWGFELNGSKLAVSFTELFVRENDGWKLLSTHETRMSAWAVWIPEDSELTTLVPASCSSESTLKSLTSDAPAYIRFKNNTTKELILYWINYEGARDTNPGQTRRIDAGKSLELRTYLTHPFALTDATGSCLGIYLATPQPGIVSIENK